MNKTDLFKIFKMTMFLLAMTYLYVLFFLLTFPSQIRSSTASPTFNGFISFII